AALVFTRFFFSFFFQAEDGIRDLIVTGVQTCALPISYPGVGVETRVRRTAVGVAAGCRRRAVDFESALRRFELGSDGADDCSERSEERRVGKECRSRGGREQ